MQKGRLFYNASNRCSHICNMGSFARVRFEKKNQKELRRLPNNEINWSGSRSPATSSQHNPIVNYEEKNRFKRSSSRITKISNPGREYDEKKNSRISNSTILNKWGKKIVDNKQSAINRNYATTSTTASTNLPEMPEPHGLPIVGTTLSLIRAGGASKLHEYVDKRHKELGPVYRERMGSVKAVFVSTPNEYRRIFRLEGPRPKHLLPEAWILYNEMRKCQRGLFFMDGDEWLHFRRIMNKLLLRPDSDNFMIGPCKEAAKTLLTDCNLYAKKGIAVPELEKKLYQWSIEVMLAILVGSTWSNHRSKILSKSEKLANHLHKIFDYSGQLSLLPVKLAMRMKLPLWNKFVSSVDNALEIVRELVKEIIELEEIDGLIKMFTNEGIQGDDLVRIVADLILAAGDTTAYSMQWGLFLLGTNPNIQEEVFESLKNVNEDDITQQALLKGVIKEALRLYPTAPFLTRFLPEDCIVGGYRVAKGELMLMSLYTSGRDDKNFTNAEKFCPERWLRNEKGDYKGVINPHASLPFALGARSCVGRKIAETQLTLTMAELIKNFKIECTNGEQVKMILHLVSVPSQPIQLVMTSRR